MPGRDIIGNRASLSPDGDNDGIPSETLCE